MASEKVFIHLTSVKHKWKEKIHVQASCLKTSGSLLKSVVAKVRLQISYNLPCQSKRLELYIVRLIGRIDRILDHL